MAKLMVSSINSHTNATSIGWHLWEIDLRFAPGLPPGWLPHSASRNVLAVGVRIWGGRQWIRGVRTRTNRGDVG